MKTSLIVTLLLLGSLAFTSSAADRYGEAQEDGLKKCEISVGGAFYPGQAAFGYDFGIKFNGHSIPDIYRESSYRIQHFSCGSWNVSFTYNFTRLFSLEVDMAYERGWEKIYSKADAIGFPDRGMAHDVLEMTNSKNYLTPMAAFKIHWLNRKLVRMYIIVRHGGVSMYQQGRRHQPSGPGCGVIFIVACVPAQSCGHYGREEDLRVCRGRNR